MALLTLPGLIDPHVHLRDPGQTEKEDFYTGTCAALAGGYTTVIDMPNNTVPITTYDRLMEKRTIAQQKTVADIGFHFGSLGDNLEEFAKVQPYIMGLKLYLNETTGNFLIDKEKIKSIIDAWRAVSKKPILFHAEEDAITYVIELIKQNPTPAHFCHISLQTDLQQIMDAKAQGLPITCGVTPHHLFLTQQDAATLGPYGKMKPPLGEQSDVDFLWQHIKAIDCIESDHAPHTKAEKEGTLPPYGVPGLETTLPLLLTAVSEEKLTFNDIVRLCSANPSKIFGIKIDPETKIEVSMDAQYTIEHNNLFTKCAWSPFAGRTVKGKVHTVSIRGTKVFENHTIPAQPGSGNLLP